MDFAKVKDLASTAEGWLKEAVAEAEGLNAGGATDKLDRMRAVLDRLEAELRPPRAPWGARHVYADPTDRWIVTFTIGYQDDAEDGASSMEEAAALASALVAEGAVCEVLDRKAGQAHTLFPETFEGFRKDRRP